MPQPFQPFGTPAQRGAQDLRAARLALCRRQPIYWRQQRANRAVGPLPSLQVWCLGLVGEAALVGATAGLGRLRRQPTARGSSGELGPKSELRSQRYADGQTVGSQGSPCLAILALWFSGFWFSLRGALAAADVGRYRRSPAGRPDRRQAAENWSERSEDYGATPSGPGGP